MLRKPMLQKLRKRINFTSHTSKPYFHSFVHEAWDAGKYLRLFNFQGLMEFTQIELATIFAALSITQQEYLDIKDNPPQDLTEEDYGMIDSMIESCGTLMDKLEKEISQEPEVTPRPSWGGQKK